jgi:hypothetical protein
LAGLVAHTLVLLYAFAADQTRLQPEIVSLAFLLWGTLPAVSAQAVARAHLISLWTFAGINKLLSPGFINRTAQYLIGGLLPNAPPLLMQKGGYLIALLELSVGLTAIVPATRRLSACLALLLHAGILVDLSPKALDWNQSVWPWNLALAFAGFALIAPWTDGSLASLGRCRRGLRPLLVLLVFSPVGFYFGLTDAYLAHNLYTNNTPVGTWCHAAGGCEPDQITRETWRVFNVPLPPEHRLLEQYFRLACQPGDRLIIADSRWWAQQAGLARRELACE